jgi:prevent-host-death family protein
MKIVNIHAAKTQLSRLIAEVVAGEDVVISKAGTPLVRLVPVAAVGGPRPLGALAGKVVEADDCWEPDPEIDALFYGGAEEPAPLKRVAEQAHGEYPNSKAP